jgi:hypothetical protein
MIVTSKRCYLNILTQLLDAKSLLNANYYIGDVISPDNGVNLSDNMKFDADRSLNPSPYLTEFVLGMGDSQDPVKRYINHLNSSAVMVSVYNWLFRHKPRGNGLQILIYYDDDIIKKYAHITCEYLSKVFGCDITFIDPMYRPDVIGTAQYVGDKEYANRCINNIRDMQLIMEFDAQLHHGGFDENVSNLTAFLSRFDFPSIVHLYELLFPEDPLPPNNYTIEHIKQIIIGRVSDSIPKTPSFSNLYVSDEYMRQLLDEYDSNDSADGGSVDFY